MMGDQPVRCRKRAQVSCPPLCRRDQGLECGRGERERQDRVGLGAETEDAAVKAALADCAKVDRECRIIAIGPFTVEPL